MIRLEINFPLKLFTHLNVTIRGTKINSMTNVYIILSIIELH